ncbi:MAG: thermonuclease family protein [Thermodesulfobacteriota bacterium]
MHPFLFLSFFLFCLTSTALANAGPRGRYVQVRHVIDGDTIVTTTGEHLRYIGIDTPEHGEFFFGEAKAKNMALLGAGPVRVVECSKEKKDRYGRTLVWVYSKGSFVNGELLSGGYGRALIIAPCGHEKRALLERLAWQARSHGRGIWKEEGGEAKAIHVVPAEAARHIGEMVTVEGVVSAVSETKSAVYMDFGPSGKRAFKAVIFSAAQKAFSDAGITFASYSGQKLSITGIVRRYKGGTEIIIVSPGQLRP